MDFYGAASLLSLRSKSEGEVINLHRQFHQFPFFWKSFHRSTTTTSIELTGTSRQLNTPEVSTGHFRVYLRCLRHDSKSFHFDDQLTPGRRLLYIFSRFKESSMPENFIFGFSAPHLLRLGLVNFELMPEMRTFNLKAL